MQSPLIVGESEYLDRVLKNLPDDGPRLAYADWLVGRDDRRAGILRELVQAKRTMAPADFPVIPDGISEEWVELIGLRLLQWAAAGGFPELKEPLLRLARPALRLIKTSVADESLPVGSSKIGGLPDVSADFAWPLGRDCRAIYNADTGNVEKPAGFLAQINFAEIADTQAGKVVPPSGVLSVFSYVNWKNPDVIGAMATYFADSSTLVRKQLPENVTKGNLSLPSQRLTFIETLDVPDSGGPWKDEMQPDQSKSRSYWTGFYAHMADLNRHNFLGYGKSWQEADPTPSKDSRHLLFLQNVVGISLHIQLPNADLVARNFGAITLNWVDFD